MKACFAASLVFIAGIGTVASAQQITDTNGHAGDATLDNHRPLIQKKQKAPTSRTVTGKVVDEINGTPINGAIVTLTDLSTHQQREMVTKEDGRFNFDDVSFSIDYELKARYKTAATEVRKLSQYDHRANVVRILTIPDTSPSSNSVSEAKKDTNSPDKK